MAFFFKDVSMSGTGEMKYQVAIAQTARELRDRRGGSDALVEDPCTHQPAAFRSDRQSL